LAYIHWTSHVDATEPPSLGEGERATVELFERLSPSVVGVAVITGADDPAKFHVGKGIRFYLGCSGRHRHQ
jgi:hypothetical protein